MTKSLPLSVLACFAGCLLTAAPPAVTLTVQADRPGANISPTMWGIFFEDINYGADGGLFPERAKNGSFEFPDPLMGWKIEKPAGPANTADIFEDQWLPGNNRHFLHITSDGTGTFTLSNEGFFGMGIEQGADYAVSVMARCGKGEQPELAFAVIGANGRRLAEGEIHGFRPGWKRFEKTVRASATDPKARLSLVAKGKGTLDLDVVSLYPKQTFKSHGLRPDMAQMLAELKPGFMRFPGGCIVEGHWLTNRYRWKTTIGPRAERKLIINRWNDEFKHRPAPDYFQSFGLGFFEYFQLCEDIGAEPLPILNCGMACQFNSGELVPLDQLDPYIQDALDLIEFANGPASSPWGSKRAAMGHRKPFNLKFLGIGNEQWLQPYIERYAAFAKVLKARHPEIQLVSSAGPGPDDDKFLFAWPKLRELKADIVDEHCYARPDWFLNSAGRYDNYDRNGPKVFMGEYAAQSDKTVSVKNRNNWECALAEAAFMTGLERNADVVVMSSYAPLFGHEQGWQWRPNLIWCDNLRTYGTPNYYVQQLFSRNRGDHLLPLQMRGQVPSDGQHPRFYATAARDEKAGDVILKIVNASAAPVEASIRLEGVIKTGRKGLVTVLSGGLGDENSLASPRKVAPLTSSLAIKEPQFRFGYDPDSVTTLSPQLKAVYPHLQLAYAFQAHSLTVLRLPVAR
jgi:alpha-L-arabinofuranosidase